MTPEQNPNDSQWLDTLAGRGTTDADPSAQQQAEALNRALKTQSLRIDQLVPEAGDAQYQQLLFRLQKVFQIDHWQFHGQHLPKK